MTEQRYLKAHTHTTIILGFRDQKEHFKFVTFLHAILTFTTVALSISSISNQMNAFADDSTHLQFLKRPG